MEIIKKPIDSLIPYAKNARVHDEAQIAQIAGSIKEFGFNNPVLIDKDNGIIAGHGRVMAARKLGLTEVPTILLDHLNETQRKAYILADNRIAINSTWDNEMLSLELMDIKDDVSLAMLGFNVDELDALLKEISSTELPNLPDGDKQPFQQKTFTLHDEQFNIVDDAITKARTNPIIDTGLNDNSNGNALTLICEQWLNANS
jgi:ParB-like chromosome segregation protein Spo0J|tara:strand:- start:1228 stop:1833 length:606 start_codon:yes stop_codon:yes gene_type:complete